MAWDPAARRWSFSYGVSLDNQGDAADSVQNARAYLSGPSSAPPALTARLVDMRFEEKGAGVGFPLTVKASDSHDLELTIEPRDATEPARVFERTGLYRLVLEVDTAHSQDRQTVGTYCFWVGQATVPDLVARGHQVFDPDIACAAKPREEVHDLTIPGRGGGRGAERGGGSRAASRS